MLCSSLSKDGSYNTKDYLVIVNDNTNFITLTFNKKNVEGGKITFNSKKVHDLGSYSSSSLSSPPSLYMIYSVVPLGNSSYMLFMNSTPYNTGFFGGDLIVAIYKEGQGILTKPMTDNPYLNPNDILQVKVL